MKIAASVTVKCENCMYFVAEAGVGFYNPGNPRRAGACRYQPQVLTVDPHGFCAKFCSCQPVSIENVVWPMREAVD